MWSSLICLSPLHVGAPTLDNALVNGSPSQSTNVVPTGAHLSVSSSGSIPYSWSVYNGSATIYPNGNNCVVYYSGFTTIRVEGTNTCGTALLHNFNLYNPSSSQKIEDNIKLANPTTGITFIDLKGLPDDSVVKNVLVFDSQARKIMEYSEEEMPESGFEIDLTQYNAGDYYISLNLGYTTLTKKVLKL